MQQLTNPTACQGEALGSGPASGPSGSGGQGVPTFQPSGGKVARQYGIEPGDLGTISYNGKTWPQNKIGEVSRYAAQQLGINASPTKGGVSSGVQYNVFPGSGSRCPPQMLAQRSGGSSGESNSQISAPNVKNRPRP